MTAQFVSEIRIFAFDFAPTGWAACDGQLLPVSQNMALFALLGTGYGGNGVSTFGLPNLQGSVPVHVGDDQPLGLSQRFRGESGGSDGVALVESEIPMHSHAILVSSAAADEEGVKSPAGNVPGRMPPTQALYGTAAESVQMSGSTLASTGGGLAHNNLMPSLTLNFCIALQGIFPQHP